MVAKKKRMANEWLIMNILRCIMLLIDNDSGYELLEYLVYNKDTSHCQRLLTITVTGQMPKCQMPENSNRHNNDSLLNGNDSSKMSPLI